MVGVAGVAPAVTWEVAREEADDAPTMPKLKLNRPLTFPLAASASLLKLRGEPCGESINGVDVPPIARALGDRGTCTNDDATDDFNSVGGRRFDDVCNECAWEMDRLSGEVGSGLIPDDLSADALGDMICGEGERSGSSPVTRLLKLFRRDTLRERATDSLALGPTVLTFTAAAAIPPILVLRILKLSGMAERLLLLMVVIAATPIPPPCPTLPLAPVLTFNAARSNRDNETRRPSFDAAAAADLDGVPGSSNGEEDAAHMRLS